MHPTRNTILLGILGCLALFCIIIWSIILSPYALHQGPALLDSLVNAEPSTNSRVAALFASLPQGATLDEVASTSGCRVEGALPDHACTPGAIFAEAGTSTICVSGYTKTVRSVSTKLRKQLYAAYNISYPPPSGTYELDHLIPLELGGNNDAANLFPQAAAPKPGFKEKDLVEDYLHQEVCAGHLPLSAAQIEIANNWVAIYQALDPTTISNLKHQFHSWAD